MISDQAVTEYIEIYEREYGKKLTKEEAYDQANNLVSFFEILYDCEVDEQNRKAKLIEYPKGYHLGDGKTYSCCICRSNIKDETTWYDKNGNKCLICQKALSSKIIPASVCHDNNHWYSLFDFEYYFKIKAPIVKRLAKEDKLKARVIKNELGKPYFYLFLIKDNQGILRPKPKSYTVNDGDGYMHIEYEKVDIAKLLKLIDG